MTPKETQGGTPSGFSVSLPIEGGITVEVLAEGAKGEKGEKGDAYVMGDHEKEALRDEILDSIGEVVMEKIGTTATEVDLSEYIKVSDIQSISLKDLSSLFGLPFDEEDDIEEDPYILDLFSIFIIVATAVGEKDLVLADAIRGLRDTGVPNQITQRLMDYMTRDEVEAALEDLDDEIAQIEETISSTTSGILNMFVQKSSLGKEFGIVKIVSEAPTVDSTKNDPEGTLYVVI